MYPQAPSRWHKYHGLSIPGFSRSHCNHRKFQARKQDGSAGNDLREDIPPLSRHPAPRRHPHNLRPPGPSCSLSSNSEPLASTCTSRFAASAPQLLPSSPCLAVLNPSHLTLLLKALGLGLLLDYSSVQLHQGPPSLGCTHSRDFMLCLEGS